jgi:hypothetical protein
MPREVENSQSEENVRNKTANHTEEVEARNRDKHVFYLDSLFFFIIRETFDTVSMVYFLFYFFLYCCAGWEYIYKGSDSLCFFQFLIPFSLKYQFYVLAWSSIS